MPGPTVLRPLPILESMWVLLLLFIPMSAVRTPTGPLAGKHHLGNKQALLSAAHFTLKRLPKMSSKGYSPLRAARMMMMMEAIDVTTSRRGVTNCLYPLCRNWYSAWSRSCYRRPPRAPLPVFPEPLLAEDFPLFPAGFPFSDCCVPEDAAAAA